MNVIIFDKNKNIENHSICNICNKADICKEEICLPLEMWVQFCNHESIIQQLEMIDNVREQLDLSKRK